MLIIESNATLLFSWVMLMPQFGAVFKKAGFFIDSPRAAPALHVDNGLDHVAPGPVAAWPTTHFREGNRLGDEAHFPWRYVGNRGVGRNPKKKRTPGRRGRGFRDLRT